MKKLLCSALLGTAVGATGLVACDAPPPAPAPGTTIPGPVAPAAIPPSPMLADVVRAELIDIVRDEDPNSQARRLGTLLPTLGADSVPAVTQTLNDLRVDLRATQLELLVRFWAIHEPEAASNWAKREAPLNYRTTAVYAALSTWAQQDPQEALKVTWDWSDIPGLESIVPIALVRGWYARNDPPDLREFLRTVPMHVVGQRALAAYIRAVVETQGPDAVKRWAEGLPEANEDDQTYKKVVFRRVVDALSQIDVASAIAWCDLHCRGPYGRDMRNLISRNWALYDGPAALAWLSKAPPGNERDLAVRLTYALWTRNEPEAAAAWLVAAEGAGEPPPWLQPAYPIHARLLSGENPLEALKWASRISDAKLREHVTVGVLRVWRTLDEAAAEKWMAQEAMTPEVVERVRSPKQEKPAQLVE